MAGRPASGASRSARVPQAPPDAEWVRRYARAAGLAFLIAGLGGLLAEGRALGVFNSDLPEDVLHLLTAALLVSAGFVARHGGVVRRVVAGQGVFYVAIGLLGLVAPTLFGLLPTGYSALDNAIHLGEGIASLGIVRFLGGSAAVRGAGTA